MAFQTATNDIELDEYKKEYSKLENILKDDSIKKTVEEVRAIQDRLKELLGIFKYYMELENRRLNDSD